MKQIARVIVLLVVILSSCVPTTAKVSQNPKGPEREAAQVGAAPVVDIQKPDLPQAAVEVEPTVEVLPSPTAKPALPTQKPENRPAAGQSSPARQPAALGPDRFPEGINPLTGLPVEDSANLALAPALVSVTNFPITARPQAGLSYSPIVFEMYIGEGMTRFLALFYGDYPQASEKAGAVPAGESIGPVRSGRLPYDSLRKLYNGFLVMASASQNVLPSLGSYTNVWGSDTSDINSAMIPVSRLQAIAEKSGQGLAEGVLSGQHFDERVPETGKPGKMLWIPYNFLNQVIWRYDSASGSYLRYQDQADGKTFVQITDRLNGEPLSYENVVILFATHRAKAETLIDIDLMYIDKMPALLFRDGEMYEIFWTTANADFEQRTGRVRPIRFVDAQGNPFQLKPGQTWVEIVQPGTPYYETVDSEAYMELLRKRSPGSGNWAVDFYPPK